MEDAKETRKCGDRPKAVPGTPVQCKNGGRFDACEARCEVFHAGPIFGRQSSSPQGQPSRIKKAEPNYRARLWPQGRCGQMLSEQTSACWIRSFLMRPSESRVLNLLSPRRCRLLQCVQLLGRDGGARFRRAIIAGRLQGRRCLRCVSCAGAGARVPRHPYGEEHGSYDGESHGASNGSVGNPTHGGCAPCLLFSRRRYAVEGPAQRLQSVYRHEKAGNLAVKRSRRLEENASFSGAWTALEHTCTGLGLGCRAGP